MDEIDSTNIEPPDFGPQEPVYPPLPQLNRVTGSALPGTNIYPALTLQYGGNLNLRDRELSYVWEPNGVVLGPGVYDCRLVGSYPPNNPNARPLYATTCCVAGGSSSSSSSSSAQSTAPLGPIQRENLGRTQTGLGYTLTLPGVTVDPGTTLLVIATVVGSSEGATVTFGGTSLAQDAIQALSGSPSGSIFCFSSPSVGGLTADIVLTVTLQAAALTIQAVQVTNLANGFADKVVSANGAASAPDTGASAPTTAANEYVQAGFLLVNSIGPWTYSNGFTNGAQDLSEFIFVQIYITEGYKILSAIGTVDAALAGVTPATWAALAVTYK